MCIHRSSLLIEHLSGLKSQSCLFTLPWIYTQALASAHSLAHLSATVSPHCKQSMACFALTPWGKHSLTLISCAVAFPVGRIDSLAVNQRRQVWFVLPQSPALWPCVCLEGSASTRPPWCECVWEKTQLPPMNWTAAFFSKTVDAGCRIWPYPFLNFPGPTE